MKPIIFLGLLLFLFSGSPGAQNPDTILSFSDSSKILPAAGITKPADSILPVSAQKDTFLLKNKLLNLDAEPVSMAVQLKVKKSEDAFFYLVAGIMLWLAFLKYFYNRYFINLFRVFFNTSLRQSQLTDQLLQAKLPSFLFNIFFVVCGGVYVYAVLSHYQLTGRRNEWMLIFSCVLATGTIYTVKYCTLKFSGWITGQGEVVNIYVFVIFLINKIIGIFLVPFIIILFFSHQQFIKLAILVSLLSIAIFLLLRFFRSYGLIQNQLKISRFHFLLYVIGLEILPLLLIYKGLMIYLTKNL